jgi:hypothetical protein
MSSLELSGFAGGSLWNICVQTKKCTVTVEEYQPPVENQELLLLRVSSKFVLVINLSRISGPAI